MGKRYAISIGEEFLVIDKQKIPLLRVLEAKRVGKGVSVVYLNDLKILTLIMLTTSNIFGICIGRSRKLDELVDAILSAIESKQERSGSREIDAEREVAAVDACHDCGMEGGAPLSFGEVYSAVMVARWSSGKGIYCKKHSTVRGVRAVLVSGFLGWWSPWGLFVTPTYLCRNIRSLWVHSCLTKPMVVLLAIVSFAPAAIAVNLLVN